MILGEGAGVCCRKRKKRKCIGFIEGYRYATEVLNIIFRFQQKQLVFKKSMKMALENTDLSEVMLLSCMP
jgi:hypothetical protein